MSETVDYSQLYYPYPGEINQSAAVANQHMLQWANALNMMPKKYTLGTTLQKMNYGWLGARVHPGAALDALFLATEWQCWLFFTDDLNDESELGRDPEALAKDHARYLTLLDGDLPNRDERPPMIAISNLYARMRRKASAEWMRRFKKRVADYFAACCWEAANRAAGVIPDPTTYCKMRLDTSSTYTCLEFIDICEEIVLPMHVYEHPQVQQLRLMANNIISWCNDLVSLEKEMRCGDVHNLVIVLQHHHQVSLQQAIQMAIEQHNAEMTAYLELEPQVPSFGPELDAQVQRYLRGLRHWMRGNLDWGLTAKRYASKTPRETK